MKKLRTTTLLVAAAAAVIGLVPLTGTAAAKPAAKPARAAAAPISWGPCSSPSLQRRGAECAMVSVPLDYANPTGTQIQLAISRIRHTVPDADYQGVMLVNPGGPGGSGLVLSILGEFVPNNAGAAYDWIGFDPRGVGSSVPAVSCNPNYFGFRRPAYVPTTSAIARAWMRKANGYAADCRRHNTSGILQHLTTVDSARDLDSIREALGETQINYYGFSYGTYLGQVYGTLFPTRVRRMVLDSNVDPTRIWYVANLDQDYAFDRNINIWFGWVAKHNSTYHLGNTMLSVRRLWYTTQAKLALRPAAGKIGAAEWTDTFLFAGYYQSTWPDLADTFSRFIHRRDVNTVIQHYVDANGLGDDNGYAVYLGVQCTDLRWPLSWHKWSSDNWRVYRKAPFETWGNAWYNEPCRAWPAAPHVPVTVDGRNVASALLIGETLDAATPYTGSLKVRQLFPNSSLIALPRGTSHANSLNGDTCLDNQIAAYLQNGTLPVRQPGNRADATCAPLPLPVPTAARRAATTRGLPAAALRALRGR